MDILQLIDRLEELFNAAKAVPFTHNVLVDEDRMLELIDQMRIAIPEEVKTFRVNYLENKAPYVNPQLSPALTERLKQKITRRL